MNTAYATVAQADAYHAARPSAEKWALLTADEKAARLLAASDYLDVAFRYRGFPTNPPRQFPRNGATDIPPQVLWAVFELANVSGSLTSSASNGAFSSVRVGEVQVSFSQNQSSQSGIWDYIKLLLRDWLLTDDVLARFGAITIGNRRYD